VTMREGTGRLDGRVAIVTGAASGIGTACAPRFEGSRVATGRGATATVAEAPGR
jgi:NAD(P)-dependent dehydrogenase (short-subunit alcohol dehydrogenase family)